MNTNSPNPEPTVGVAPVVIPQVPATAPGPELAPKRIPLWRFWVPMTLQALLVLGIPAQSVYTHVTGRSVVLQTIPVDPYDLMRGYYVVLSYDISDPARLRKLPGWSELMQTALVPSDTYPAPGTQFYLVLEAPKTQGKTHPHPWKPIALHRERPNSLSANQVALAGQITSGRAVYGLESYYIPEDQRIQINETIAQAQTGVRTDKQPIVVEVKVDHRGQAVPISFWVGNPKSPRMPYQNYRF
ncbi:MAG: GDYXXLXY domain-containing protein [Leptolyngbyaceae cyanobacterium bins.59]|nr:GDYXXLXY domain-containing protein [Leptolyngbyaceae cyanobacterium bins.59]